MYIRKILFGLVFILLCANISYSQSGWVWQNPTPGLGPYYYSTYFANNNSGWATGRGKIFMTTNGGDNWVLQYDTASGSPTFTLNFINSLTGFAISGRNLVSTTNGGINWQSKPVLDQTSPGLSVYFKDQLTGFITAFSSDVLRTTNGGINWTEQFLPNSPALPITIKLFNATDGILFTTSRYFNSSTSAPSNYYKTTNGGASWIGPTPSPSASARNIFFLNAQTGWMCAQDTIYRTTNGGTNWNRSTAMGTNISLSFLNSQTGYSCGDSGKVYKTIDAGVTWIPQKSDIKYNLYHINCINENNCIAVGANGAVIKTSNAGGSWSYSPHTITLEGFRMVKAINPSDVFAITFRKFFKSFDGGTTWEINDLPFNDIYAMSFVNSLTGWIGGYGGGIYVTYNGGLSWNSRHIPDGSSAYSLQFINAQTGWAAASFSIFKTTNSGTNWIRYENDTKFVSYSYLSFINESTGWAVQENGAVKKTINGGINWFPQDTINEEPSSMCFINAQTGWIATDNSMNRTTNGGSSWDSISNISIMQDLYFANSLTGWGLAGPTVIQTKIYHTTDGGFNWQAENTSSEIYDFEGLSFINSLTGWAVGSDGTILKTTTGGNVFISQTSTEIPEKYSLYQNYPNPFNPSTNIKFDIHKPGIASLKVFDLLGKEMETLVDEQLSVGTYEVTFNAASLPSGIYFYVLKTGEFLESKKMMLVK